MEQTLNDKKLEIQTQFDDVTKQVETKNKELEELQNDQLRLQGAYRLVEQLIATCNESKETPIEGEVVKKANKRSKK